MRQPDSVSPTCRRCDAPVTENITVCSCGTPTVWMGFEERARFEVEQYKAWKDRQPA